MTPRRPLQLTLMLALVVLLTPAVLSVEVCRPSDCTGEDCPRTECHFGSCTEEGTCDCSPCWKGNQCDTYRNDYLPVFSTLKDSTRVAPQSDEEELIYTVTSVSDGDWWGTCEGAASCPCAEIVYSLADTFGGAFRIDETTGRIYLNPVGVPKSNQHYILNVLGHNRIYQPDGSTYLTSSQGQEGLSLSVEVEKGLEEELVAALEGNGAPLDHEKSKWSQAFGGQGDEESYDQPHHRSKRSNDMPTEVLPDNVTFHIQKMGDYENVTEMRIGSKIDFRLIIQFPAGTRDMLVELFTPDNDTTVMVLCGVNITHIGSELTFDVPTPTPVMDAKDALSTDYDRAILDFGNVTNAGGGATPEDHLIIIEWTAVMIDNSATQNGSTYWVSAGAEYNDEAEVWVGQAAFTTVIDSWVPPEVPTFNLTGPAEVEVGASVVFRVDMFIPYPSVQLTFDAFAPINKTDVMSVCSVFLVDTGLNYQCLKTDQLNHVLYKSDSQLTNARGRLDIGTVTNAGSREPNNPTENNRISVEFVLRMSDNDSHIGQEYSVGAAVEIGTNQIWAGQISFLVIARVPVSMSETPTFTMTRVSPSGTDVTVGQTVVLALRMDVPEKTESDYELEVLAPFNESSAVFRLCKIEIISNGVNVPCLPDSNLIEYSSRGGLNNSNDRAVWPIGRIKNTGHRSTSVDPDANAVTFRIVVQVLNHSLAVPGAEFWTTAGVTFRNGSLWVGQSAVVIVDNSQNNATNASTPLFTLAYPMGADAMPVGAVTLVTLDITTVPGQVYYPMDLELILPYENDTAVLSVCRAEITFAGENLPCFQQKLLNASIEYTSKGSNDTKDKAIISLGHQCNTGTSTALRANDITITMAVKVEDHVALENGTRRWISMGLMYSETKMWVGQIALYALRDRVLSYPTGLHYYTETVRTDDPGSTDLGQGMAARYLIYLQLPPQACSNIKFTATTSNSQLSVCSVRLVETGWNMPCLGSKKANYTEQHPDGYRNKVGVLDLGTVCNIGTDPVTNDTTFGNNTVVVEMVVHMEATATGTSNLDTTLELGTVTDTLPQITLTAITPPVISSNDSLPSIEFNVTADGNNDISHDAAKGVAKTFNLEIIPTEGSQNKLIVKFLTPVNDTGVMEVCSVNVLFVGANFPCLKKEIILATFSQRSGSTYNDIGEVDLGYVCHVPIDTTDPDANRIRVEAIMRVTRNNTKLEDEKVWASATVRINDDHIAVNQVALYIKSDFNETVGNSSYGSLRLNTSSAALDMSPGQFYNMTLVATIPPNSTIKALVDVQLPVNGSAVMTVHDIKLLTAGANLACLGTHPEEEFVLTFNSTQGTTQNDRAVLDFYVTNTGVTYRMGMFQEEDNELWLEVLVQMADAEINVHLSQHWASFGAKLGGSVIIMDKLVVVQRDNTEVPDLELEASLNNTITYTDASLIEIDGLLKHSNQSSAEAYNVSASFFLPPYVSFVRISYINFTMPEVSNTTGAYGIALMFERIFFTDIVEFRVELSVSGTGPFPQGTLLPEAITPYEAGSNMIWRQNHQNASGTFFMTQLSSLTYRVEGPAGTGGCAGQLGLEDGRIQDCQISASYSPNPAHPPAHVRINGSSGWESATRGRAFHKYIQISFLNSTRVTKVALQHPTYGGTISRVSQYQLYYSDDGYNWEAGETVSPAASYGTTVDVLTSPQDARYVRLMVLSADGGDDVTVGLKAEFYGCSVSADTTPADVCQKIRTWDNSDNPPISELRSRSFLVGGASAYLCDANPTRSDLRSECYFTSSTGVWTAVDRKVIMVEAYDSSDGALYGVASDRRSFTISKDGGATWYGVPRTRWQAAIAKGVGTKRAQGVPWTTDGGNLNPASAPVAFYTDSIYAVGYEGLYEGGVRKLDWTKCCA